MFDTEERGKYISMFRIDGEPILPPLMTMERRLEMQMYREKAAQLEGKLQQKRVQFNEESLLGSSRSHSDVHSDNTSLISSDAVQASGSEFDDSPRKILINASSNTDTNPCREFGTNTPKMVGELSLSERASLLEKSGPIGFDLVANAVITSLSASEKAEAKKQVDSKRTNAEVLRELVEKVNLGRSKAKKSMHLNLAIPSICVNPPTPITDVNKMGEVLSGTESVDSVVVGSLQSSQPTQNQLTEITEDSTDESCQSQSTEHIALLTSQKKITNVTARIMQFEQADCRAASEDDQSVASRPPKRSATSPSLKSMCEKTASSLTSSPRTEDTSAPSLVRSSSFTLDVPSKALIDHMQKQYEHEQSVHKSQSDTASAKPVSCSKNENRSKSAPSAWRDTVESKAKRVQKKLDFKPTSRQGSSSRSKAKNSSFNTYPNSTAHLWNNPLPPVKVKKSPYDGKAASTNRAKTTHTKSSSGHKHQSTTSKSKSKKPNAVTTYAVRQTTSLTNATCDIANEIESTYRHKLNTLIAQQRDEEHRMQQLFNAQRQMLLDQLNNEKFQGTLDADQNLTPLQVDGFSIGCSPTKFNGNFYNSYNSSTCATLESLSPTVSITSSYLPCGVSNAPPIGFSTTTTIAPCNVTTDLPSASSSIVTAMRSPQRSPQRIGKSAPNRSPVEKSAQNFALAAPNAPSYNNLNDNNKRQLTYRKE